MIGNPLSNLFSYHFDTAIHSRSQVGTECWARFGGHILKLNHGPDYPDEEMSLHDGQTANVKLVFADGTVDIVSQTRIEPGQPLTFNYNTTEWSMAEPFEAWGGTEMVEGFSHLCPAQQQWLVATDKVAPHIRELWEAEQKR